MRVKGSTILALMVRTRPMGTATPTEAAPVAHGQIPVGPMVRVSAANDNGLKRDVFVQLRTPTEAQAAILADIFAALMDDNITAANDNEQAVSQAKAP